MGSYSRRCEIVEAGEEHASAKHSRGFYSFHSGLNIGGSDRKPPILKQGYKESLEDDINQLFEAFCLKKSSKGLGLSNQFEKGMSPLRKDFMKRPVTVSAPQSPRTGSSDPVSLKLALRELCLSKASEMAATKRLSRSSATLGVSEAERIKGLYSSVVVETGTSSHPLSESMRNMVEISFLPEESKSVSSNKLPQHLLKMKSADQSAHSSPRLQELKSPIQSARSSPKFAVPKAKGGASTNSLGNEGFSGSRKDVTQALKSPNQSGHSSPRFNLPSIQDGARSTLMHNPIDSASKKVGIQASKSPTQSALSSPRFGVPKEPIDTGSRSLHNNLIGLPSREVGSKGLKSTQSVHSSPRLVAPKKENFTGTNPMKNEVALSSKRAGTRALKAGIKQKQKHLPATSVSYSNSIDHGSDLYRKVSTSAKVGIKLSPSKSGRRGRFQTAHSSVNGNRITKLRRTSPNSGKSAVRTKTSIRKKTKQGGASSTGSILIDVDGSLVPSTGQLVCHKCHCTLKNVIEEPHEASPVSFPSTLSGEVSLGIGHSGAKPNFPSSNCNSNKTLGKAKSNSKSREKGDFSQSSKSSLGDFSTSTSNSDISNASRSSWSNRPHMPKDSRWQAIRHVKMQDGGLNLDHLNLLKKIGSGDIGTVYLAELIGSNCLFAIKVMDNEYLARRKKLPRALTEREILKMLDHPFLPTLYAQFTSDNLSCLVMEYCPGGDLHVLRQKQPARSFPEPAARFYVAEVLLALEYLHMLGIIYRDLKPENILVREDGHIMLTDFDLSLRCSVNPTLLQSSPPSLEPARTSGPCTESSCMQPFCLQPSGKVLCFSPRLLPPTTTKAKKIKAELAAETRSLPQLVAEPTDARSNSFVGTHEYLAPEIIKGDGHGAAVDWWTFGILLYELLYGKTPFKGSGNDETLANVVLQSLKFPNTPLVSFQARDLISRLLVKEPENRLGTEKGAAEIKQHPFFEGLNWALIRCAIPPEQPEFYDIGALNMTGPQGKDSSSGYLQCKATSDHFEFELF